MAIIPVNLARVSQNLRAFQLLESVRSNTAGLYREQNRVATGLKFNRPSEDPLGAAAANAIQRRLEIANQLERNLLRVNTTLAQSETAVMDAMQLLMSVQTLALETASDTSSPDERSSLATVVDSVLDQLIAVGNRTYLGSYLFGGLVGGSLPFELTGDGVLYRGGTGRATSIVDTDMSQDFFTLSGAEFFEALSGTVRGIVDLNPVLTSDTRISELRGTTGRGVSLGRILVSDGVQEVQIDLGGADTVGDIVSLLNAQLPGGLQATLSGGGIVIGTGLGVPTQITIRDVAGGHTARDLGLTADGLAVAVGGADLDPRLTLRTQLADLNGGAGLALANGLTVTNGSRSVALDFTGAETLEDVLNVFNHADVGVWARLADDGNSIEVVNRIAGSDLRISENGGTLAGALGIRTLSGATRLADLNDGRGVDTVDGADLRITTADGTVIEVDLDDARTLQDVVDLLNAAGGGAITVGLVSQGNGLQVTDNTVGPGTLSVERANLSPAIDGLGLNTTATGGTLVGADVNPVRTDSAFTALVELRDALRADDRARISFAGQRLDDALARMQEVQGRLASRTKTMEERSALLESEVTSARMLLSDVQDADLAEVIVRFQQMEIALQANMATAARVMNLSLMDYLR